VIDTKLILVEGLPGSGKSTTCQKLYRVLRNSGLAADYYHEFYQPHPIVGADDRNVDDWVTRTLSKWKAFVQLRLEQCSIAILDAAAFQCTVGDLLEMGAERETMKAYALEVLELIRPLRPSLIYIYQQDVQAALKRVCEQRPTRWRKRVQTLLNDTVYGRNRALDGWDLYFDYNRTLRALCDELFQAYDVHRISLENSDGRWDDHFGKICRFVGVSAAPDTWDPNEYCGEYRESEENQRCQIALINGSLQVTGLFAIVKGLLPKHDDVLFVQTWPDELTFERNDHGRVVNFRSTGSWNRIGDGTWWRHEGA